MKKIMTLTTALCGLLLLTGCIEDKGLPAPLQEFLKDEVTQETTGNSPADTNWESFTFESLTQSGDLTVSKGQVTDGEWPISTSKYTGDFLVVAVYSTDCELCQNQAPWLDQLAQDITSSVSNVNFVVIFSDLFADSADKDVAWIKNLSYLDSYTNVTTACSGSVCRQVFAPKIAEPMTPTVYFVDTKNVLRSWKAMDWDTVQDPQNLYLEIKNELADFMGLLPISFDPTTGRRANSTGADL